MKVSDYPFNPRNVKAGQVFSRLFLHGMACEKIGRWMVRKVLTEKTGRRFVLSASPSLPTLTVCSHILKTDFARWNGPNGQPLTVGDLSEIETDQPTNEKPQFWYD